MTERALSIVDELDLSRRRFLKVVVGSVAGIYSGLLSPTEARNSTRVRTLTLGRLLMGTVVEIEANHPDLSIARDAVEASLERMAEVDHLMSIFRPDSEISLVNRLAATLPVSVGEETFSVLTEAKRIGLMSGGALDVTIHPLMQLWRYTTKEGRLPSSREIEAALGLVAHSGLSVDHNSRRVQLQHPGMGIDLGGIAKGYAVDAAAEALKRHGINSGLLDAGGDLR
ncbi:MAG: FAD:protein FMN transferase, partial [Acidobacteria bacterium]|nr:FAD:protein FMN transferase [Acidobacteriota bacterium]